MMRVIVKYVLLRMNFVRFNGNIYYGDALVKQTYNESRGKLNIFILPFLRR